jgi:hypothetical protein
MHRSRNSLTHCAIVVAGSWVIGDFWVIADSSMPLWLNLGPVSWEVGMSWFKIVVVQGKLESVFASTFSVVKLAQRIKTDGFD